MIKFSLFPIFYLLISPLNSFAQEQEPFLLKPDSLRGSWIYSEMKVNKRSGNKSIYYSQSFHVFQFEKDSFKQIAYFFKEIDQNVFKDSIVIQNGTYQLRPGTITFNKLSKKGEPYSLIYQIQKSEDGMIEFIGKYSHSYHYQLRKQWDKYVIKKEETDFLLNEKIFQIEYIDKKSSKFNEIKKVVCLTALKKYRMLMNSEFPESTNSRYAYVNSKIVQDKLSENLFLLFSSHQKPIHFHKIVNDTIFGQEVEKNFRRVKIYPAAPLGMSDLLQGNWEVAETNGPEKIISIRIQSDSISFLLNNPKIIGTKIFGDYSGRYFYFEKPVEIDSVRYNYLFIKHNRSTENVNAKWYSASIRLSELENEKSQDYFSLRINGKKINFQKILFSEQDAMTGRHLIVDEAENAIWAYLSLPNELVIEKDCFLASRTPINLTQVRFPKIERDRTPLPMTTNFNTELSYQPELKKEDISVQWNKNGDVILKVKNDSLLRFTPYFKRGFSKSIKYRSYYGYAWENNW